MIHYFKLTKRLKKAFLNYVANQNKLSTQKKYFEEKFAKVDKIAMKKKSFIEEEPGQQEALKIFSRQFTKGILK